MPLMPWFLLARIARACHTKRLCAASPRQVAPSLILSSSSLSSPLRRQRCPRSSPPPAHLSHQLYRSRYLSPEKRSRVPDSPAFKDADPDIPFLLAAIAAHQNFREMALENYYTFTTLEVLDLSESFWHFSQINIKSIRYPPWGP